MTPEEIKSIQAYAAAAFGQPEAVTDVIEAGDYVRIVEDADMGEGQDLIYLQDIQAVGVVRGELKIGGGFIAVQFPRGQFAILRKELYLVDVDALPGEMEEMIAEEAEQSESAPKVDSSAEVYVHETDARDALAREYEAYRAACRFAKSAIPGFTDWLEMRVIELKAVNASFSVAMDSANEWTGIRVRKITKLEEERDSLAERVTLLEAKLTPFALAAQDGDVRRSDSTNWLYVVDEYGDKEPISCGFGGDWLEVRHLREALAILPNVNAGAANADSEQA